jgi:hypothetical protein
MTYQSILPTVFPYGLEVDEGYCATIVHILTQNESSFAVTVDAPQGRRNIWISKTSAQRLVELGFEIPDYVKT